MGYKKTVSIDVTDEELEFWKSIPRGYKSKAFSLFLGDLKLLKTEQPKKSIIQLIREGLRITAATKTSA